MTTSQAARIERRRIRRERERIADIITAFLTLALILAAFAIAGTMDFADQQTSYESWLAQNGVD